MADVTVLIAIYNAMPHLPAAIESIRAQTYADWRMVVVNDGSSDGSVDYLQSLGDPRIQLVHQDNRGLGAALNHGLQHCETRWTARMDGDDIAHPSRLAKQVAFLREHPEVGLLGTQIERMGSRRTAGHSCLATDHETIDADIARGRNQMYHPTIMCCTATLKAVGGYWTHPRGEEWDLFLRMGEVTRLANLSEVLLSYRVHTGSMTGASVDDMRRWIEYACDCAQRRRNQQAVRSPESFFDSLDSAPLATRLRRRLEMHARNQYRIGVGEMLGDRPAVGRLRLGYSALWSPGLSWARLRRIAHRLVSRRAAAAADSNRSPSRPSVTA